MLSAATRSSGASFVTTRKRLQELVGPAGANAVTAGLGGGSDSWPAWTCSRVSTSSTPARSTGTTFNQRYGHRGPHEFEISRPRPGEDPAWLAQSAGAAQP